MGKKELNRKYKYEFGYWLLKFESQPIEEVVHDDRSQSYEKDTFTIFKLEDGNYVTVVERGCSCYMPDKALIEIFSNQEDAIVAYQKWDKEQKVINGV